MIAAPSAPNASPWSEELLPRRLMLLMAGRLVVGTLLLSGTLFLRVSDDADYTDSTPRIVVGLIVAIFATSAALGLWVKAGRRLALAAASQLIVDIGITTVLVAVTGGAGSVFTILYGGTILMAALTLGPTAATAATVVSVLVYSSVGVALASGWIPFPADQSEQQYLLPTSALGYALLSNMVGMVLVATLAVALANRLSRTGGALHEAEASARMLERLNDRIVRSISSGLMTTDLEMRIETVNPAGGAMLRASAGALRGHDAAEHLPLGALDLRSTGGHRGEGEARRADGTRFPVGFTISPLLDDEGTVRGTLVSFQDLTEIRELERAAERAERLAVLGRLAAGLAHEIRNPLSSISGSVEMVREAEQLGAEDRRLLAIVGNEIERLDELVTTMLHVGRPSTAHRSATDVAGLIEEVRAMASTGLGKSRDVSITSHLPEGPLVAHVDPSGLRQVVWNLLKNAVQASPIGGKVELRAHAADDGALLLEVSDEGPGIEPTERDQIFEMFYSKRTHGVGLGLALVLQIVAAHGGEIDAINREGGGATFRVRVPAPAD